MQYPFPSYEKKPTSGPSAQVLKTSFRANPESLEAIRGSLNENQKNDSEDLVEILERHHDYLQESIVYLVDPDATVSEKQAHLDRFIKILGMHAKAEEETLYEKLEASVHRLARIEGLSHEQEHKIASGLAEELQRMEFEKTWTEVTEAKAEVLAHLVATHIQEEESTLFPAIKRSLNPEEDAELSKSYLAKCRIFLNEQMHESH